MLRLRRYSVAAGGVKMGPQVGQGTVRFASNDDARRALVSLNHSYMGTRYAAARQRGGGMLCSRHRPKRVAWQRGEAPTGREDVARCADGVRSRVPDPLAVCRYIELFFAS